MTDTEKKALELIQSSLNLIQDGALNGLNQGEAEILEEELKKILKLVGDFLDNDYKERTKES